MAAKAIKAGRNVAQGKLPKPLKVAGVGNGTNEAKWEVHVPIALEDTDGHVSLHEYRVPVITDEGRDLPALLGLQSLARQNSILEMAPGHEFLTLPGPGGYSINWSPGTVRYKLEQSPSGHLLLPCDDFAKVSKERGGVKESTMTFFGNRPQKPTTCEMSTQTDPVEEFSHKKVVPQRRNKHT